ncbi:MAG: hypothetical protein SH856_09825 [Flavobacteriales bacterium]|nr:hypothetical protein [Flavobacteriales bacterium]
MNELTRVAIDYFNGNNAVVAILSNPLNLVFLSCIAVAELQQGASNKLHLNKINKAIAPFPMVDVESKSSQLFSKLF